MGGGRLMGGNYAAAPRNAAASPPPRKYRPFKKGKRGLRELCVPSHRWRINLYAASGNQAKEPTPKARTCLETDLREGLKLQSLSLSLSLSLSRSLGFVLYLHRFGFVMHSNEQPCPRPYHGELPRGINGGGRSWKSNCDSHFLFPPASFSLFVRSFER